MQSANNSGHDVFSINHRYHLDKLRKEKYAYLTDLTAATLFVSENCDYVIAPERFFPMLYTVTLQKNSAYTDEVTQ